MTDQADSIIALIREELFQTTALFGAERDGDKAVFSSGYGESGIVIDVQELAVAAFEAATRTGYKFTPTHDPCKR